MAAMRSSRQCSVCCRISGSIFSRSASASLEERAGELFLLRFGINAPEEGAQNLLGAVLPDLTLEEHLKRHLPGLAA